MKFKILKTDLLKTLNKIIGPTLTKQNFPILNSVLISAKKELTFITTDLDTTIINKRSADISEEGDVVVPMKNFFSIIKELPNEEITITKIKNNLSISCENVEFKITTLSLEDFPKTDKLKSAVLISIKPEDFEEMIRMTAFCVGTDDVNYVLNGVLFEIEKNNITMVSTDGKRLAYIKRELPEKQSPLNEKISTIIPVKGVIEVYKLIKEYSGDFFLSIIDNKICFCIEDTQFFTRPIEGEFPDYLQYIPTESNETLSINRADFMGSLKRAALLTTPEYQGVKLDIKKDKVIVSKSTPQMGDIKETIKCEYQGNGITIGFNPVFLIDVMKNIEEESVKIMFYGADKPAVLKKDSYIYLVLPMKI
ncbi:MAG: DNA polymerase III subunit beta [Candidatus Omnitrophica bacterium]|nr:DNA polymerase III subunit beta [Candidatus Omnitrophota bacterium]MDD5080879.1 DNA polymerase III subunit beta [Candidatus Omnitrophota bacterium]MDD5441486.1 DNA polymerase III subunit beta [Candidatus Omnitrophota bacterium]